MDKFYNIFLFFYLHTSFIFCIPTELLFSPPFTVTGLANPTTFFVHDAAQHHFVLKYHPRGPKRAIHDALGAYIGKSIGININEVELFAANPIGQSLDGVTTLHTLVPGKAVRNIKTMDKNICIKRGIRKEKTLRNLVEYKQLCDIIAFDIFVDNTDRHNGNLFFDRQTGLFYAIDLDHGFKSAFTLAYTSHEYDFVTVATRTYRFIKTLKKSVLSHNESTALKRVQQMLLLLINLYPPALLFDEWMLLAQKANVRYNPREQEKIKKYLEYNAGEVERLIVLLDKTTSMVAMDDNWLVKNT
jgi:hypothetical protein